EELLHSAIRRRKEAAMVRPASSAVRLFPTGRETERSRAAGDRPPYSLDELTMQNGGIVAPHSHKQSSQIFYVLDGEITVCMNSRETRVGKGDCIGIEAGITHSVSSQGSSTFLVFSAPARCGNDTFGAADN